MFAPAGDSLSFVSPKESKQRKGEPDSSPVCAGILRCSTGAGCAETRLSPQTPAPLIRPRLRYSPPHNGVKSSSRTPNTNSQSALAPTAGSSPAAERSEGVFFPHPFCMRRGAQLGADQGRACLSRRRVCAHPTQTEQRSVPAGPTNPARLFFAYFLLAKQKKVSALSGAYPDTQRPPGRDPAGHAIKNAVNKTTTFQGTPQSPAHPPAPAPAYPAPAPSHRTAQSRCQRWC